jgi:segregation and condensation protein B
MENLTAIIEAILFVSGDPVRVDALAHAMNLTTSELNEALAALGDHLALENRGIQLNRSGETVFLSICPKYAGQVEAFLQPLQKQPLSQAVLETLSIIAYRQPVTKGDIEAVRGVKCDYSVQSLLNKGFIEEQGRRETLGRPILYGTTEKFLQHFGLERLEDLPPMQMPALDQRIEEVQAQEDAAPGA